MSEHKLLDAAADVLPVGLQPTPFGEVWQALKQVAAQVWDVDPSVYRAGIAWLWYALRNPEALASDGLRALLVAALISEQAPLVKDTQTAAELAEYLRMWRDYTPTYPKLEALYSVFAARVEVRPISDAESQGVVPVDDRRLAFYLRVESFDPARALSLDEVYQIAVRATPLGSRPVPYYALVGRSDVFAGPASAGLVRALWASEPAVPVTPPTPAYTEITLYMASGNKNAQTGVTSSYIGNVTPGYCYQLYTDDQLTIPWTGYDYSNDYKVGYISSNDGQWYHYIDSVTEMPDNVGSGTDFKVGRILLDTGYLWLCCNLPSSSAAVASTSKIVVRIYPKDQQQYSLYFSQNTNTYNNYSTSGGMVYKMKHLPGNLSYGWMPWSKSFPERTIVNALYSSGKSGVSISHLSFNGTTDVSIKTASGYAPSFRNVIFTLDVPTYTSWANLSGNKSAEANEVCPLLDRNGEYVVYDPSMNYTIIGLFNYSGGHPFNSPNRFMLDAQLGAFDTGNPTRLCFKLNRAVTFSYVWYIKTPTS